MAVIALDIGGTKCKGAVITPSYKVVKSIKVPTHPQKGKRYVLETIRTLVKTLSSNSRHKITAIGVSIAGSIDRKGRLVDLNNTMPSLQGTYIRRFFSRLTDLPVIIENDGNSFTLAESIFGKAKHNITTIGIIWGTGIGAGMVTRQFTKEPEIYHGVSSSGLEIGHNKVFSKAYNKNVEMEKVAGGKFLPTTYKKYGGRSRIQPSTIIKGTDNPSRQATTEAITQIAYSIALLINTFNPDRIVFGGGLSNLYESINQRLLSKIQNFSVKEHYDHVTFSSFSLSDDEGILGAAHLALKTSRMQKK